MKLEQVRCFFQMLTQLDDIQPYEALVSTAVTTVTDALKPNVDPTLQPLQLLAAAIANESYQRADCLHLCRNNSTTSRPQSADYSCSKAAGTVPADVQPDAA